MSVNQFLTFAVSETVYAIPLVSVVEISRVVAITPLPKAPEIVLGIVNIRGRLTPVVDFRKRFGLAEREMSLSDQFIVADTPARRVALVADRVERVIDIDSSRLIEAERIVPHSEYVTGVVKLEDGLLLIHDLATFLSLEEERSLDEAFARNKDIL